MSGLNSKHVCQRRPGAFTLLELLVVIGVLAVLAGLLLPVMARAKENARRIQCLGNLKQWALAFNSYALDHEFIPREGHRTDGFVDQDFWSQVADRGNGSVWYNALPGKYLSWRTASSYASRENGDRPKFYQDRLFHCPTARFVRGVGFSEFAYFSTAMNSKLIQEPTQPPNYSIKHSSILEPVNTVSFLDARVNEAERPVHPDEPNNDLGQPSACASRFAARHGVTGNLSFVDGHVDSFNGRKVVETRPLRQPGYAIYPPETPRIIWCADPQVDPHGAG